MIKWLARLFVVWVAIIFAASATEEILDGCQSLVKAPNEAASATTTGNAAFPPVKRKSRTAEAAMNRKRTRSETDGSDDDLLTISLGNREAYSSYPSSLGQPSSSGVPSGLTESGVSLEKVNSQDSSSIATRDFLSDFDKTRETDASASTERRLKASNEAASATNTGHAAFLPVKRKSPTADDVLNTAKKDNFQTNESDDDRLKISLGNRGAYPSYRSSLGQSSSPGVISGSTESGVNLGKINSQDMSSSIATRGSLSDYDKTRKTDASASTEHYTNFLTTTQGFRSTGRRANDLKIILGRFSDVLCLRDGNILCDFYKPDQPQIHVRYPSTKTDGKYGRLKFNTDLFMGEGLFEEERKDLVKLLYSIPTPNQGNFLLTYDQLVAACKLLKDRHSEFRISPFIHARLASTVDMERWFQYWNKHAKIDLKTLRDGEEVSIRQSVFPIFLFYVEMIISIIPYKQGKKLNVELDYPQEMNNAIKSYLEFNKFIKYSPEIGAPKILNEEEDSLINALSNADSNPSKIIWKFIEFWMVSHYKAVWNQAKEDEGLNISKDFKVFFDAIFTYGIDTVNINLFKYLLHK